MSARRTQGLRLSITALAFATASCSYGDADAAALTHGGDAERGKALMRAYGCGTCHTIPGVRGANATVGPDLAGIANRAYVGGVLPNTPENLMRWIQNPQAADEKSAMPNLGVSETDARHLAAYLYTLR